MTTTNQTAPRTQTAPTTPEITAEMVEVFDWISASRITLYFAHGPDGHTHLVKRLTREAALRDGLAYFLETRELDASGRWVHV